MKIALVGAQGVGKTTLAKKIQTGFPGAHIVKETVRECPYPCDKDADFKTEWWVLSHSILEERVVEEMKYPLIIADRCLLDISVYTKLISESNPERISAGKRQLIENVIGQWLKESPYDLMFFVTVDPKVWIHRDIDDGFRSIDPSWYDTITKEFESAIERLEVKSKTEFHVIENDKGIEESYSEIASIIKKRGLGRAV